MEQKIELKKKSQHYLYRVLRSLIRWKKNEIQNVEGIVYDDSNMRPIQIPIKDQPNLKDVNNLIRIITEELKSRNKSN